MDETKFRAILHEEFAVQRKKTLSSISEAIGYDLRDPEELKNIRKDLWMVRTTRLRSDRFKATGERIFFVFFWGTVGLALLAGTFTLLKEKLVGVS